MRFISKWAVLSVLFVLFSCTQVEKPAADSVSNEPGIYGYLDPIVDEDAPATKATVDPTTMQLGFEAGDRINIWSNIGTLVIYSVQELTSGGGALFDGGGFQLTEGDTYYSSYPLIVSVKDDYKALTTTYEGQVQTADGDASHVADFTYTYADSPCTNGRASFAYHYVCRWLRFVLTLPKNMTVTELTVTADSDVFTLDGKLDVTTGAFTPGRKSNTMTLALDNVSVTDGVLNAFMALAPYTACNVVVRVKDDQGKVYASEVISQNDASTPGNRRTITTALAAEITTSNWAKVTDPSDLTSGTYAIVYPTADGYKLFSFEKTMANAQSAAALVADKHTFAEVVPMRTQLFQTCVAGNYETIEVPADPNMLEIPNSLEPNFAISATTAQGEAGSGTAVLTSTSKNLGFKSVIVALGSDNAATITAAVDPNDFSEICDYLRGHDLKFAFTDVMEYIAQEVELSESAKACALDAFDKMCIAAKNELAEHNYDLGTIDRNTKLMDVFEDHYWFFADKSLGYDSDKALGWIKPVGFYVENDGFSGHIPMPVPGWFDDLAASFNYGEGGKAGFVAYWQKVDTRYPRLLDVFGTNSFFGRIASEVSQSLTDAQFNKFAEIDWVAVGKKYQRYTEDLNKDPLANVYIYKKVE